MRDVMRAAYDACEVGGVGFARPDPKLGESVEAFQSALLAAEVMQEQGFIVIQDAHRESSTGNRWVDFIKFARIK